LQSDPIKLISASLTSFYVDTINIIFNLCL
jgi:hypothetical protein